VTWYGLRHQNVLPLLGVTMEEKLFVMVSDWMENGNINEFVKRRVDADRLGLVCPSFKILLATNDDNDMIVVAQRHHQGADLYA